MIEVTCPRCAFTFGLTEPDMVYTCPECGCLWEPCEDEFKEPIGIVCEGCGARINPDYGKCTRCE